MNNFLFAEQQNYRQFTNARSGERRFGESLQYLSNEQQLTDFRSAGGRYVLLGVPEDIGPRGNLGRGGATGGWLAFNKALANLQDNGLFPLNKVAVLGEVNCADLQQSAENLNASNPADLKRLRELCAELDHAVEMAVSWVAKEGLVPVVIGGGHNNAFPILKAMSQQLGQPLNSINLDPHSDFRTTEGRHSGNGFSYAHEQGYLDKYFVMALDEQKNNAANLKALNDAGGEYISMRQMLANPYKHQEFLQQAKAFLAQNNRAIGIEIDLDVLSSVPVSAYNFVGLDHSVALHYLDQLGEMEQSCYLHLAEGAPAQSLFGEDQGEIQLGQLLCHLVLTFIEANARVY